MHPGFNRVSASGTWHSRLVYSGVASRPTRGINSCSLKLVGSAGEAAADALADSAYSWNEQQEQQTVAAAAVASLVGPSTAAWLTGMHSTTLPTCVSDL